MLAWPPARWLPKPVVHLGAGQRVSQLDRWKCNPSSRRSRSPCTDRSAGGGASTPRAPVSPRRCSGWCRRWRELQPNLRKLDLFATHVEVRPAQCREIQQVPLGHLDCGSCPSPSERPGYDPASEPFLVCDRPLPKPELLECHQRWPHRHPAPSACTWSPQRQTPLHLSRAAGAASQLC